jgi:hypothetical protein
MPAYEQVPARDAGPEALGILVPPGLRTLLILRPRPLAWDLIAVQGEELAWPIVLRQLLRKEAAEAARRLLAALEQESANSSVEAVASPGGDGYLVCCRRAQMLWIACPRRPGLPYEPALFGTQEEAEETATALDRFLTPAADAGLPLYCNTENFR